jgi:antitoxin component of RelBE/YafQ-DinJ toxin-antitoxin module
MTEKKRKRTTLIIDDEFKNSSLKIAKKKGINTLTTLVNILLADYIEKNRELLERKI